MFCEFASCHKIAEVQKLS